MELASHALSRAKNDPNQDAFQVDDARGLYLVSDGLGMYHGGDVASRIVIEEAAAALTGEPPHQTFDRKRWFSRAAKQAAKALHARGKQDRALKDMSATLTLLLLREGTCALVHVGDSRAYLWRDDALTQLTSDHSVAWEQYQVGALTKEQARTHPNQKLLTRSVTARQDFAIAELLEGDARSGDLFLLCSDGISKELSDAAVAEVLRAGGEPAVLCERLVDAATAEDDDTTVVVVQVG